MKCSKNRKDLSNSVKLRSHQEQKNTKMATLPKRQNDISHIYVPLLQCTPIVNCLIILSHISLQKLELCIPQITEIDVLNFWMLRL